MDRLIWGAWAMVIAYGIGLFHSWIFAAFFGWKNKGRCEELQQVNNAEGVHRYSVRCTLRCRHTGPHRSKVESHEHWWVKSHPKPGSKRQVGGFTVIEGGDDGAA